MLLHDILCDCLAGVSMLGPRVCSIMLHLQCVAQWWCSVTAMRGLRVFPLSSILLCICACVLALSAFFSVVCLLGLLMFAACFCACVHAGVRTCVRACMHACMHACVLVCMRACLHACVCARVLVVARSFWRQEFLVVSLCSTPSPLVTFHSPTQRARGAERRCSIPQILRVCQQRAKFHLAPGYALSNCSAPRWATYTSHTVQQGLRAPLSHLSTCVLHGDFPRRTAPMSLHSSCGS